MEILKDLIPANLAQGIGDDSKHIEILESALKKLHGNRTDTETRIQNGKLESFRYLTPSRPRASRIQQKIRTRQVDFIIKEIEDLLPMYEDPSEAAQIYTHCGELFLWTGRYKQAKNYFEKSLELDCEVIWSYTGLSGVAVMEKKYQDAFDIMTLCNRNTGLHIPSTAFLYLGEAYIQTDKLEDAFQSIQLGLKDKPYRLSGWINLAIIHSKVKKFEMVQSIFDKITKKAMYLVKDAKNELALQENLSDIETVQVLEKMLIMMRGNRSSRLITYYTSAGDFRFVDNVREEIRLDQQELSFTDIK